MTSTCYANIVTVKKMLSLIEEQNKAKTVPKIGLSAVGLTAFAKKSGMTSGWESGDEFMLVCGKLDIEFFFREVYKVHATCQSLFTRGNECAAT